MSANLYFLASEYYATGEGITVSLLITRAYPRPEDYKKRPDFNLETKEYFEGELWYPQSQIAENEFTKEFGTFFAIGVEHYSQEEFFERFGGYVPKHISQMFETGKINLGNFRWTMQMHVNYS